MDPQSFDATRRRFSKRFLYNMFSQRGQERNLQLYIVIKSQTMTIHSLHGIYHLNIVGGFSVIEKVSRLEQFIIIPSLKLYETEPTI